MGLVCSPIAFAALPFSCPAPFACAAILAIGEMGEILGRGYLRDQCQRIRDSSGIRWREQNEFFFACKCYWDCFTLFVGVALTPFLTRKGGENGTEETVRTLHLPKRLFSSMIDNRLDTLVMSGVGVD